MSRRFSDSIIPFLCFFAISCLVEAQNIPNSPTSLSPGQPGVSLGVFRLLRNNTVLNFQPPSTDEGTKTHNVLVSSKTVVTLDGKPSSLSALRDGMTICFLSAESDGILSRIDAYTLARDDKLHSQPGIFESTKDTIVTFSKDQSRFTVTITTGTLITLDEKLAKPADLCHGMPVQVLYRNGEAISIQAVTAEMDGNPHRCEGDFVSGTATELVLHVWGADGFDITFKLAPDFKIIRNNAPAAITDFKPGEHVVANYTDAVAADLALLPPTPVRRGPPARGPVVTNPARNGPASGGRGDLP